MAQRKQRITNGDEQEVGLVEEVYYDRSYRTLYNRWGDAHRVPSDPVTLSDLLQQGWTTSKPAHPEERPVGKQMADGSIFYYNTASQETSEVEIARINRNPSEMGKAAGPTATYYNTNGDAFGPWPADPESLKGYMEIGFTLTAPAKAPATPPRRLRAVKEA
jgi:hypothetical protein